MSPPLRDGFLLRKLSESDFWVLKAGGDIPSLEKQPAQFVGDTQCLWLPLLLSSDSWKEWILFNSFKEYCAWIWEILLLKQRWNRQALLFLFPHGHSLCHSLISNYPRHLLPQAWLAKGQPIILRDALLLRGEGTVSWRVNLLLTSGSSPSVQKSAVTI